MTTETGTGPNSSEAKTSIDPGTLSFEEQFAKTKREYIQALGAEIGIVEVKPENLSDDAVPVLLVGGWTEGPEALKGVMEQLREEGRWSIAVEHPARGNTIAPRDDYPEAKLLKAANYESVLRHKGITKTEIIAHSGGAGEAVILATLSDKVSKIVFANPEGLIGKDSFLRLGTRFQPKLARSIVTSLYSPEASRALYHGTKNASKNLKRALDEVNAIASSNLMEAIATLREKGIKIGVLQSRSDWVFLDKRIMENITDDNGELLVDSYASNVKRRAGHDELLIHPERGTVAADQMLRSMADSKDPELLNSADKKTMESIYAGFAQKRREIKEKGTLSQRGMAWAQTRWNTSMLRARWKESKVREAFVIGENAKRNQYIALAIGSAAMVLMARKGVNFLLDNGADVAGNADAHIPPDAPTATPPDKILPDLADLIAENSSDVEPDHKGPIGSELSADPNIAPEAPQPTPEALPEHIGVLEASGDTIWADAREHLVYLGNAAPSDTQIFEETQRILDLNKLSWEDARNLPVGFRFQV